MVNNVSYFFQPMCDNHDDGETAAIILCNVCGNLCTDCDRFLHLHRRTKTHQRQVEYSCHHVVCTADILCAFPQLIYKQVVVARFKPKNAICFCFDGGIDKFSFNSLFCFS